MQAKRTALRALQKTGPVLLTQKLGQSPLCAIMGILAIFTGLSSLWADEPPALNPFGQAPTEREDAVPGFVELSDSTIHAGMIYLTRDKRLQIYDKELQRQREIPLHVVKKIECAIKKEWLDKEWRFKESANNEKVYTGRSYPVREYVHTITLKDGRTITGPLSAIVYVQPPQYAAVRPEERQTSVEPEQFLLNKRTKGEMGKTLKSLVYVKRIKLGKDALEEAKEGVPKSEESDEEETTSEE